MIRHSLMLLAGFTAAVSFSPPLQEQQERRFIDVEWTTVLEASEETAEWLAYPGLVAGYQGQIAVYDYGRRAVVGIDESGDVVWTRGGESTGGRFERVSDLGVDGRGWTWITDSGSGRVIVLDHLGQARITYELDDAVRAQPLTDGRFLTLSDSSTAFIRLHSEDGAVLDAEEMPQEFGDVGNLARQGIVAPSAIFGEGHAVVSFIYSSSWLGVRADDGELEISSHRGLGPGEFPTQVTWEGADGLPYTRVHPRAENWALSAGIDSSRVYVFIREEDAGGRIIDVYDRFSGEYQFSLRSPQLIGRAALVGPRQVAAIVPHPIPHIVVWEWSE